MKKIVVSLPEEFWDNLKSNTDDADFCYLCNNHVSSGHDLDCPLHVDEEE